MKKKSVKINIFLNTFRMALTVLMPLITFPYVSRIFLTDGTGQLNFANSVVTIFALFASLGIYTYGVREGVKVRNNKAEFSHLAQQLLIVCAIATVLTYIVFFICVSAIPSFSNHKTMLYIYSITILFMSMGCDWIYGVYEEYSYITARQIVIQIFTIIAMFVFVHEMKDIYIWAGISVVSAVGANVFNFIKATRYISFKKIRNYDLSRHIFPILVLFATQLASKVYNNLDTVLIGAIATDHDTGVFSAAVKVNTILVTVFAAMLPVFLPRIVKLIEKNQKVEYENFLKKILSLVFCIAIPSVVGLEILRYPIVILLAGEAFAESATTMSILVPVVLITTLANVIYYNVIVPANKEKYVLICTVIAAGMNLVVSVILIPILKANGAAIASLVAETVGLIIALLLAKRTDAFNRKCLPNCVPYIIGSLGVAACCILSNIFLNSNLFMHILGAVVSSVISYGVVLIFFREQLLVEGFTLMKSKLLSK